jgi:hypothetical protein
MNPTVTMAALAINMDSSFFMNLNDEWTNRINAWKEEWRASYREEPTLTNILYQAKTHFLNNMENNVQKEVLACSQILLFNVIDTCQLHNKPGIIPLFLKLSANNYDRLLIKKSIVEASKMSNSLILQASKNIKHFVAMLSNRDD